MLIGYARVSTDEQTTDPQVDRLKAAGCVRIYTDAGHSGRAASRPEWDKLLDNLRPGDVLKVTKLDRIGRSVRNLIDVVNTISDRGADLVVLDQQIDTTTPGGKLIFHIMAAVAEFEADIIRERTHDGLAAARARGRVGGGKPKLSPAQVRKMKRLYDAGELTGRQIAEQFGIHYTTMYEYLRKAS